MSTLSTPRLDHNSTINENKNINNSRDNRILNDPGIQSLHSLPRTNTTFKNLIIPEHSSLPSPLSPPLSVSPSSSGSSMADFIATQAQHGFPSFSSSSSSSLPPFHPSSNNSSHSINDISHPHLNSVSASPSPLATIQTSPEAWLAHAAEQRRHLSSASFSSTTSSSMSHLVSPQSKSQSPVPLEFGESEQIQDGIQNVKDPYHQSTIIPLDHDHDHDHEEDEQEPELNMNLRPSELRASLMARAKRSSARLQKKRSESMPIDMLDLRLSMQSNQRHVALMFL
ncbi:hypothetical protein BX616_006777 [Lobosporangium transversale]|uniref:Uncharacterized protein n=1 Tax=Lobosporangium transversale TaxID=64571 RepID=A0A1Y2GM97_9FUNG|nr:hypothetical protein BCR41DRAFT_396376 [Lobosporangium transversale]KAF9896778.1 hypothetical protein BX616_006777 [Lobosporangium transversale]ORZ15426.1 hypothetical protein BCR41DRAFT_396376 [Lobosporangium transversale]|eukprot:XP_021881174.1 hypothetical protein BCR41DRAFT_396376 [Lobosporangium transversale]